MSLVSVNGHNSDIYFIINAGCFGSMWFVWTGKELWR